MTQVWSGRRNHGLIRSSQREPAPQGRTPSLDVIWLVTCRLVPWHAAGGLRLALGNFIAWDTLRLDRWRPGGLESGRTGPCGRRLPWRSLVRGHGVAAPSLTPRTGEAGTGSPSSDDDWPLHVLAQPPLSVRRSALPRPGDLLRKRCTLPRAAGGGLPGNVFC